MPAHKSFKGHKDIHDILEEDDEGVEDNALRKRLSFEEGERDKKDHKARRQARSSVSFEDISPNARRSRSFDEDLTLRGIAFGGRRKTTGEDAGAISSKEFKMTNQRNSETFESGEQQRHQRTAENLRRATAL